MTAQSSSGNPSGWSFPENDNVFRQNQLKLSVNASIRADIEKYRYKELVDSFLVGPQLDWVDELMQCTQGYDEVNQEIIKLMQEEIDKENLLIEEKNLAFRKQLEQEFPNASSEFLDIQYKMGEIPKIEVDFEEAICLTPTAHRVWAESKNICQISKSKEGIGVRTASTQKLIREDQSRHLEVMEERKRGILGGQNWRNEPNQENQLYG